MEIDSWQECLNRNYSEIVAGVIGVGVGRGQGRATNCILIIIIGSAITSITLDLTKQNAPPQE